MQHINDAVALSNPTKAAGGEIAYDPVNSAFNGGKVTSYASRQEYSSGLLADVGLMAVLNLGEEQYFCGGYLAFLKLTLTLIFRSDVLNLVLEEVASPYVNPLVD